MKSFKEKAKDIIWDELGRWASKFPWNKEIVCSCRLLHLYGKTDFDETIELATFIKDSWTDLELNEAQIEHILNKTMEIIKRPLKEFPLC